jgi:FkbM family methyltransferase
MILRRHLKYLLYDRCPGLAGRFRYYGTTLYFPLHSVAFRAACEQGVFEIDVVQALQGLVRPNTWFFDIGANIGLMSAPILRSEPTAKVLAFEPSPNVLPWLQRSISTSRDQARWTLIPKAVGARTGIAKFALSSPLNNFYDGLRNTARVETIGEIDVQMTTIDAEWIRLARPHVSVIKIDIEGGELDALAGALDCIHTMGPDILLEWNRANIAVYGRQPDQLLQYALETNYDLFSIPGFVRIENRSMLELQMIRSENFLLRSANRPVKS